MAISYFKWRFRTSWRKQGSSRSSKKIPFSKTSIIKIIYKEELKSEENELLGRC